MGSKKYSRRGSWDDPDLPVFEKFKHRPPIDKRKFHPRPVANETGDFRCVRCKAWVSGDSSLSGVVHRNHCPFCLTSRHVDAVRTGDRSSTCRAAMRPIGLSVKESPNRYASGEGELMLIHECLGCGKLSINRIAADDPAERLVVLHNESAHLERALVHRIASQGIRLLGRNDLNLVLTRLYGVSNIALAEILGQVNSEPAMIDIED
jgi:hypothetical protein